ncbi:hypothetical protein V8F33_004726 [Rhypophila sp. PSN 637]
MGLSGDNNTPGAGPIVGIVNGAILSTILVLAPVVWISYRRGQNSTQRTIPITNNSSPMGMGKPEIEATAPVTKRDPIGPRDLAVRHGDPQNAEQQVTVGHSAGERGRKVCGDISNLPLSEMEA